MTRVPTTAAPSTWGRPAPVRTVASTVDRFTEALQPRRMGPRLAALTGTVGTGAAGCHVLDAKFEPGVRAIVLYELDGRLLRGDLLPAREDLLRGGEADVVPPGIRCHSFPFDPEIPTLHRVFDPAQLSDALAETRVRRLAGPARSGPVRYRLALLRYRPGKRATALVTSTGGDRYIVKAYHDPAKAAAVAEESVAVEAAGQGDTLQLAPTLAHLPELAAVVQRPVAGVGLERLLAGPRGPLVDARPAIRRAGRALAEFHAIAAITTRERPVDRELARFGQRAGRIAGVAPQQGLELMALAERLIETQRCLPACRPGVVHGDCKPSQFLVRDDHVLLMDLDHLGVADQLSDVGTFLASLRQLAVRHALSGAPARWSGELALLSGLFMASYTSARGIEDVHVRIRWHEAVALQRKALRAFARAPRSPLVHALTAQAHRCLDDMETHGGRTPTTPWGGT